MRRFTWAALAGSALTVCSSIAMAGGLLVVAPHPDDELLMAAGVIASAKARGEQVKVVFMTNGDYSGEAVGLLREAEAVKGQIGNLGTSESDLIFLGYPDGGLAAISNDYPNATDVYWGMNNRSTTYGAHGLGSSDFHTYRFGSAATYNRPSVVLDLQTVISTYLPDHIITTAEYDQHPDHSSTFHLVKDAINGAIATHPGYNPSFHKSIVWADNIDDSATWPAATDPTSDHVQPLSLAAVLSWTDRESIDVPVAMQNTNLLQNLKYKAINAHVSQGGAPSFLGRFVHKDEVFWLEQLTGATLPPKASAGTGQTVEGGAQVQLNGAGSVASNGGALTYNWQQVGGPVVIVSGANTATPTFTAPSGLLQETVLSFELTVQSGTKKSIPDLVTVNVLAEGYSTVNVASQASVTASSENAADGQTAAKAVDGVADGYPGDYSREWAAVGERAGAWLRLQWAAPATVSRVVLFDRPNTSDFITGGTLTFSDGSSVPVPSLVNGGGALEVAFAPRTVSWVKFTVGSTSDTTDNVGLAEMQVFGSLGNAPANQAPVADAGTAQTVASGAQVQLDASASSDAEGTALIYNWTQVSGNTVNLSNTGTAHPTFTAPVGLAQNATLVFQLVVNDGQYDSAPATVAVTVTASGQPSVNVAPQATVTASSQNSADGQLASKVIDGVADGYPGDYTREWAAAGEGVGAWVELHWNTPVSIDRIVLFDRPNGNDQVVSGTLTFSDGTSVPVSALNNDGSASQIVFSARTVTGVRLTVTGVGDNTHNVGLAEFQVFGVGTSSAGGSTNQAPVANAGLAQTVAKGSLVQLNGSASIDPEGALLTYTWRQVAGPAVTLSSVSEVQPLFVAPNVTANTTLTFELVVNDGQAQSAPSNTNVVVTSGAAAINIAPQASVSVSSENAADSQLGIKAVDGVISGYPGDYTREWATQGQQAGAWIELRWSQPMIVERVVLYDRPNGNDHIVAGTLTFSDGTTAPITALNNDGSATQFNVGPKTVTSIRFSVTGADGYNIGLSEFEVFGNAAQ